MTTHVVAVEEALSQRSNAFPSPDLQIPRSRRWLKVFTKFLGAVRFEVPIGYQDETGFHYGEEPVPTGIHFCGDI